MKKSAAKETQMSNSRRIAVLTGSALAALLLTGQPAAPAQNDPAGGASAPAPQAVTTSKHEKLSYTVIQSDSPGSGLTAGFNTVFQATLKCNNTTNGCTIVFETMVQVGDSTTTGNRWAICALVDGLFANPGCPYAGVVPSGDTFETRNALQNYHVAAGSHTAQVQVYVDAAATFFEGQVQYSVYSP
jgi:hypothetical protein